MRLLRTIRLDASDEQVFERAAAAGEWAVPGAFTFAHTPPEELRGKAGQAFARGFLGTDSFGWSTLVAVANITPADLEAVIEALARHFVDRYGAPSIEAARPAARAETAFAQSLCEQPVNTLVAVERALGPDGIVERFRTIEPLAGGRHARIWSIAADDLGDEAAPPGGPASGA
jgi:Family of unknown function (DUF6505)